MATVFTVSAAFTLGFFLLSFLKLKDNKTIWFGGCVAVMVLVGLTLRIYVSCTTEGFTTDLDCFKYWGSSMSSIGPNEMYYAGFFLDYPPGYLYVLWLMDNVVSGVQALFGMQFGMQFWQWHGLLDTLYALPPMLSDLVCAVALMYVARRETNEHTALFVGAAYILCPAVIINSAQWGQVDSFCTMLLFFSILFLYYEKWVPCGVFYGLSAICKPQMFVFIPVYVFFVLRQEKKLKPMLLGFGSGLATMMLVATPFIKDWNYWRIVELYKECMGGYKYYSVNGYNIWCLLGMNWQGLPEGPMSTVLTVAAPLAAVALCGCLFLSKRKDVVFAAPTFLMTFVFCFAVKQHERYLFPALLFGLLAFVFTRNRWQFWGFLALDLCTYLNVAHIFSLFKGGQWQGDMNGPAVKVFSAMMLGALALLMFADFVTYFDWRAIYVRVLKKGAVQEDSEDRPDSDGDDNGPVRDRGVLATGGQADAADHLEPEGGGDRDPVH